MKSSITFLLLLPTLVGAQIAPFFLNGNTQYQNGAYQEAIASYEAVLQTGFESPELYYNLGNAYFKLQNIGKAVLYYEKAKKLAPRDPDIAYNLGIVQLFVVDRIETPPQVFIAHYWQKVLHLFNRTQLSLLSLTLYLLLMALLIGRFLTHKWSWHHLLGRLSQVVGVCFAVILLLFLVREQNQRTMVEAVVMADKVEVLSGPAADATPVFALHEGIKLQLREHSATYVQIRLPDGKVGWLPQNAVEKI